LDRALDLFWERGYDAVSVDDLVQATGLNRFALYHQWGDKRGLLLACLDRYFGLALAGPFAGLLREGAGRADIEALFQALAAFATAPVGSRACFALNTVLAVRDSDPELFAVLRGYLDQVQGAFAAALARARERGEVPRELDVEAHAATLAIAAQAVFLQGRTRPPPEAVHHFVRSILSTLEVP
jgi:TetR/AcrR family transcriptional repressor of nem operon